MGDIHPQGNPHIQLNPRNIAAGREGAHRATGGARCRERGVLPARGADFAKRWTEAIARWESRAAPLKGVPVVVMHRDQAYLCNWLGLKEVAAIEPKPGVPPSAGYLGQLVTQLSGSPPRMILRNAYNDPKAANWLSERVNAPAVVLPFSVGGTPDAKDLFGLFDDTLNRLLAVPINESLCDGSQHPVAGADRRHPGRRSRTCRSASRCWRAASSSSISRSRRSRDSA